MKHLFKYNRTRFLSTCLLLLSCFWWVIHSQAHDEVHHAIHELDHQIEAQPHQLDLYFLRGQMHQKNNHFNAAFSDFQTCQLLAKKQHKILPKPTLSLAKLCFQQELYYLALLFADKYISQTSPSNHTYAYITKARCYAQLNKEIKAKALWEKVLATTPTPKPEYYLTTASIILKANNKDATGAIQCLQNGIKKLGDIITLQTKIIEIAQQHQQYEVAITMLNYIIKNQKRQEKWLLQKANLLLAANQPQKAKQTYQQTLTAIQQLPKQHQVTPLVQQIKTQSQQALHHLKMP